jgi:hypothetical protein
MQEAVKLENISVLTDAHLRNKTKTAKVRHADYVSTLEIVGEAAVAEMEQMIKQRLTELTNEDPSMVSKAFHRFDRNNDGSIDIREFDKALKAIGIELKEIEVYALFGKYVNIYCTQLLLILRPIFRYDSDCEGVINYPLFRECVLRGRTPNRRFRNYGLSQVLSGEDIPQEEKSDDEKEKQEVRILLVHRGALFVRPFNSLSLYLCL